ncbi:hypothetical protein [Inediibacterium massiliense]|uniref:hypothetical protein n=1 Tax=Inediibacterium massiliense TaxID=1658111 RepID=UPI0006B41868|nr:hypothetical protein [Inediibacterium massiliense]
MTTLVLFELRKILTKRITLIGIVAVLILNFLLVFSTLQSMYSFDGRNREGTGITAVNIDKEIAQKYQGTLTDEKVQKMLNDFKPTTDFHGLNVAYLYTNATQSSVHARFSDQNGDWNGITVADVFSHEKITIGYVNGWLHVSQYMTRVFIVLSLLIVLMIAPVFSGEYGGVDSLILTTKYGKTRCGTAKNIGALLAALLVTAFFVVLNIVAALVIYGHEGLDCSILFAPQGFIEAYIPFNITCATLIKYQMLLTFTCMMSVVGITILLSSICKNQIVALVTSASIFMLPLLLPVAETNLLYKLVVLMPVYQAQFISIMSVEQMSNGLLYAIWAIPMAVILIMIGYIISRRAFAKHQVS